MTNLAFTALIKSKGYNKQRLADACDLSSTQMSNRINGANDWRWPEVCTVCQMLDISLDEFATYFPSGRVKPGKPHEPTREEKVETALFILREVLI